MQGDLEDAVSKVAGGMFTVFLGLVAGALFRFLTRMFLFRGLSEWDYGIITLGMVILETTVLFATVGLRAGSARFISFYRGEKRKDKIWATIRSSIHICIVSSIVFTAALFLLAGTLASAFNSPQLTSVLRVLAIALPFAVAIMLLAGIFRGFDRVEIKAIWEDIVLYGLTAALVLVATMLNLSLAWTAFLFSLAFIIAGIALVLYSFFELPKMVKPLKTTSITRALLVFSIPLALESLLNRVIMWTDTYMLGIQKSPELVGIYNTAVPFVNLMPIFLLSLVYIFLPVATRLLAEGKREQIGGLYRSATKWSLTFTLPLFLTFLLFSKPVILFFAGDRYSEAWVALAILSVGLFTHVFAGPNGMTLVVLGRSNLLLLDGTIAALINIILNYFFIRWWGINGAAIASAVSLCLVNLIKSLQIFWLARIHPFSSRYLRQIVLYFAAAVVTYPLFSWMLQGREWMVLFLYPLYMVLILTLLLASRSLEVEDITLVSVVLSRLRIDPTRAERFLSRFITGGKDHGRFS